MKRFVDIRHADTGYRFAFWDTVVDRFEEYSGEMAWDTFREFEEDFNLDKEPHSYRANSIERYRGLTPDWAMQPTND